MAVVRDAHAFFAEAQDLVETQRRRLDRDFAFLRNDAPPRRVAHESHHAAALSRRAGTAREGRNEFVARDAPLRNALDDLEDAFLERSRHATFKRARRLEARVARISTGTGDDGTTGLVGGSRVRKSSLRVEATGSVDELNDALGLAASLSTREDLRAILRSAQADLFTLGAELASPAGDAMMRVTNEMVARIVAQEDRLEASLPPLKHFILPGGTPAAAALQLARSIARRAERDAWRAHEAEETLGRADVAPPKNALVYLNRLSDLLFLLAREENVLAGVEETQWLGKSSGK